MIMQRIYPTLLILGLLIEAQPAVAGKVGAVGANPVDDVISGGVLIGGNPPPPPAPPTVAPPPAVITPPSPSAPAGASDSITPVNPQPTLDATSTVDGQASETRALETTLNAWAGALETVEATDFTPAQARQALRLIADARSNPSVPESLKSALDSLAAKLKAER